MGIIYIIRNTVDDKVYIGQTIRHIEDRWRSHKFMATKDAIKTKLYEHIRYIGIDKFYIEELEKCPNKELDSREIYYISKFDSFRNGLNSTPGGQLRGERRCDYEDRLIMDYIDGMSYVKLGQKYDISLALVSEITKDYHFSRVKDAKYYGSEPKKLVMYQLDFTPIRTFKSIAEAAQWIRDNTEFKAADCNVYNHVCKACACGNVAYGHRWQYSDQLEVDGKVFRTTFDIKAYKSGHKIYKPEGKSYYVSDDAFRGMNVIGIRNTNEKTYCMDCGVEIPKGCKRCSKCDKQHRARNIPEKDELWRALLKYKTYESVGRAYGVTGKAVKKWCLKYGIEAKPEWWEYD